MRVFVVRPSGRIAEKKSFCFLLVDYLIFSEVLQSEKKYTGDVNDAL